MLHFFLIITLDFAFIFYFVLSSPNSIIFLSIWHDLHECYLLSIRFVHSHSKVHFVSYFIISFLQHLILKSRFDLFIFFCQSLYLVFQLIFYYSQYLTMAVSIYLSFRLNAGIIGLFFHLYLVFINYPSFSKLFPTHCFSFHFTRF